MIIGLIGTPGAGKGTTYEILNSLIPLEKVTFSDLINEELKRRNLEIKRENLQKVANEERDKYGPGIWAERALERLAQTDGVIDGIRSLGELRVLSRDPNFFSLGIDAPQELRFMRCIKRNGEKDQLTYEQFQRLDNKDRGLSPDSGTLEVDKCLSRADYLILNLTNESDLQAKVELFYQAINGKRRPTWDEVFMAQTQIASKRSTCLRRKVGALLVKDNRVIATGYNASPSGITHCNDKGSCLRQELNVPSGQNYELCFAVHAEENALLQCAKYGPSTIGSTFYTTVLPCSRCTQSIINAGIQEVVSMGYYPDKLNLKMLNEANIKLRDFEGVMPESYFRIFK